MTVYFSNRGHLDLLALATMGVSVKESDSPIGFFGTGLKFAMATLLRTGHTVSVRIGGRVSTIGVVSREIRREMFSIVTINGEPTGFTTRLGRNWQVWQAYRELACNAMDEPDHLITMDESLLPSSDDYTIISVSGSEIEEAHDSRDEIFCSSPIIASLPGVGEMRCGASRYLYYRGVRAHTLPSPSAVTWNITSRLELTEDRTVRYSFLLPPLQGRILSRCNSLDLVTNILLAPSGSADASISMDYVTSKDMSQRFRDILGSLQMNMHINQSARELWKRVGGGDSDETGVTLSKEERACMDAATRLCRIIDPDFVSRPNVVVSLGRGVLGAYRDGRVLIARHAISMGVRILAGTLYEEYLHEYHAMRDCDREMQNCLLTKIVELADRNTTQR